MCLCVCPGGGRGGQRSGELAAWRGGWRGAVAQWMAHLVIHDDASHRKELQQRLPKRAPSTALATAAAMRRLALATLLHGRLAEDSGAGRGVYGWCFLVAEAEAVRTVLSLLSLPVMR